MAQPVPEGSCCKRVYRVPIPALGGKGVGGGGGGGGAGWPALAGTLPALFCGALSKVATVDCENKTTEGLRTASPTLASLRLLPLRPKLSHSEACQGNDPRHPLAVVTPSLPRWSSQDRRRQHSRSHQPAHVSPPEHSGVDQVGMSLIVDAAAVSLSAPTLA